MCFSLQQPPALAPISLQLPAASTVAWNNRARTQYTTMFSVDTTPPLVHPYKNSVLPQETLSSYTDNPYQCPTTSHMPSHHEGVQITEFGTKEMFSSMNTSEMPTHTTHNFVSSTSNTLSTVNVKSGWELMKPLCNKTHEEKHSSYDPNISGKSSRNYSVSGARPKETHMASGTAASEDLKKFSQLSLRTKSKHKCAVCMLLCEHNNELFGSKNGGRIF